MTGYQQKVGKIGEDKAASYLKENGFTIVKKNFNSLYGEVDIIAEKKQILYFIEVKTRSNLNKGKPYEAVTKRKISHLLKAANYFLLKYPHKNYRLRLGVISILMGAKKEIEFYDDIS